MEHNLALIASPLNGPLVWAPVSRELRRCGLPARVLAVADSAASNASYWAQHATSIAEQLDDLPLAGGVVLVGHSGAGALLPLIGQFSPHPVAGYVFVDAGLPLDGQTRLDEIAASVPELVEPLRERLQAGGWFPEWTEEEAREVIPDEALRQGVLAELRPRSLAFFSEPIPPVSSWPDAPCGYIRFSSGYDVPLQQARDLGWPYREFDAGHFHMLVDPQAVSAALIALVEMMG